MNNLLFIVNIVNKQIERLEALLQPLFNTVPLMALNNARYHIVRPLPIDIGAV